MPGPEATIEKYLDRECRKIGGVSEKFTSPGRRSVPDRLCQFDYDLIVFVEVKAPGEKPTPLQVRDHNKRKTRGHDVWVVDSKVSVDNFIAYVVSALKTLRSLGDTL